VAASPQCGCIIFSFALDGIDFAGRAFVMRPEHHRTIDQLLSGYEATAAVVDSSGHRIQRAHIAVTDHDTLSIPSVDGE